MNLWSKIGMWFGIIMGALGIAVGILATINPTGVAAFMDTYLTGPEVGYYFFGFMALIFLFAFAPLIGMGFHGLSNLGLKGRLRKNGQKTTATILEVRDTGVTVNLAPLIRLTVETPQKIRGSFNVFVSRVGFPRVGEQIEVVYDPSKPEDMLPASQL